MAAGRLSDIEKLGCVKRKHCLFDALFDGQVALSNFGSLSVNGCCARVRADDKIGR